MFPKELLATDLFIYLFIRAASGSRNMQHVDNRFAVATCAASGHVYSAREQHNLLLRALSRALSLSSKQYTQKRNELKRRLAQAQGVYGIYH